MPRGRHTSILVTLSPEEQAELRHWQRSTTINAGRARRARLITLVATGQTIRASAALAGMSCRQAYKWLYRFQVDRVAGLQDRSGRAA